MRTARRRAIKGAITNGRIISIITPPSGGLCYDRLDHLHAQISPDHLLAVCCVSTAGSGQSAPPAPPKLILVIAVDQMRFDFLERFAPLYRSGLKTLSSEAPCSATQSIGMRQRKPGLGTRF